MIGTKILHYQIEERLGEGGMGVVYLATDTKLGRKVALKFLPAFVAQRAEEKARFMREAQTASALDHPNIATIYEVNEVDDKLFYAMSLVEGVTLKALRQQGPVTHKQIIQLAIQIAEGLAHAHDRGVVHRDIKPHNIMVTTEGRAKILDFGLAKIANQDSISGSASTTGTAAYMSPEQAQGQPATDQSDLFSLGVVLYELVAGVPPFGGDHPAALMYSIVHEDARPLSQLAPQAPPALVAIIERLMAKDPAQRYGSAHDLVAELRELARDLEYSSFSGSVTAIKRESSVSWRSVAVAALAVLALGVGAAYLLDDTGGTPAVAGDQYDLAVMYFEDLNSSTDDQRIGEMVTELLITDLSRLPYLRVLSSQRLYDILKQMEQEEQGRIDRTVASDIARRARARNMITGSIATVGDRTRVTANVIDVASGDLVRAEQVEGTDLFAIVDSLSARVRANVNVPEDLEGDRLDVSVAQATTDDPEAYRHYVTGLSAYHRLDWSPALAQFDSAIAIDSQFVLAYIRAGIAAFSSNRQAQGYRYLEKGREGLAQGTLPPRESLFVAAFTSLADNEIMPATELFLEATERFPEDKEAYFWLGTFQRNTGSPQEAIATLKKSLELDPTYPFALLNLIDAYRDLDDIPNAISMAERYRTVRPDEATPRITLGELYMRVNQPENARVEFEEARRLAPGQMQMVQPLADYFARVGQMDSVRVILEPFLSDSTQPSNLTAAHSLWAAALFLDGRFDEAFAQLRRVIETEKRLGDSIAVAGHWIQLAYRYLTVGEVDSADLAFERAYRIDPDNQKFNELPFRVALAREDYERAEAVREKIIERLAKMIPDEKAQQFRAAYDAQIAMARGDFALALEKLRWLRRVSGDPDDYSLWIGRACLETGDYAAAREELAHSLVRYTPFHISSNWLYSWYYLGRTHEGLGNQGDAAEAYRTFLRYWGDAERPLPEIALARERLREVAPGS